MGERVIGSCPQNPEKKDPARLLELVREARVVAFDKDGVLIDSEDDHRRAFQLSLAPFGIQLAQEEYDMYLRGRSDIEGLTSFFMSLQMQYPTEVIENIVRFKKGIYADEIQSRKIEPKPGIYEALTAIRAHGIPMVVVSSSTRTEIIETLQHADLVKYFSAIISAEDLPIGRGKPHPDIYQRTANVFWRHADRVLVVEDSPFGVMAGAGAGMKVVGIETEGVNRQDLYRAGASYVAKDAFEIAGAFNQLPRAA